MAQISPVLQYLLSRPSFNGPQTVAGFSVNAPFAESVPNKLEGDVASQINSGAYPEWLALYLGSGDPERGKAILQAAVAPPSA